MREQQLLEEQNVLIMTLTRELPVLRARLGMSQEEIARTIGVTRQTYGSIETGKREMSWTIFVALIGFFRQDSQTALMLEQLPGFMDSLSDILKMHKDSKNK